MSASLEKLRQNCGDDLVSAFIKHCDIMEDTLRAIGVEPSNMSARPNYDRLTPLARLEAFTEHCKELANVATKQTMGCTKLIYELTGAIERIVNGPLQSINNETIDGLGETECKKVLKLAIKSMFFEAKQLQILIGEDSARHHLTELFKRRCNLFEKHAEALEQELHQRSSEQNRISTLQKDVAKCSDEVRKLRTSMKALSKRLHNVATGSAKLLKELRKCEKSAMESSVERILSVVQVERDAVKDLQAKLREVEAKKEEIQMATKQLHDNIEELRHQLNEAVAEKTSKQDELEELMEKRIRCSVCMDHEKDTVFVCGHAYCSRCASEWRKCTICVTEKGSRPITFRHPLFL